MKPRTLDIAATREELVKEHIIWQLNFENAAGLQRLAKQKGLSVNFKNVEMLWQAGLLRADFVTTSEQEDTNGLRLIFEDSGTRYLLDDRVPQVVEDGWLNQGMTPKPSAFTPYFHPFRLYTLYHLLRVFDINLSPLQTFISVEGCFRLVTHLSESLYKWTSNPDSAIRIHYWNQITELVVLLEPLHLPTIDGRFRYEALSGEAEGTEPPRVSRRLHFLRGWGHGKTEQILTRG